MSIYTGYIYNITNEINGHTYIGKTNNLVRRWKEHCYGNGRTAILDKAFKKYGLEHFVFDIIAQIPFDNIEELNAVLNQLEAYYIALYDTFNNGYNATAGGDGTSFYHHSEETKKKISQSQIGKTLSEEHKEKCRVANLGNHHTDKAKKAIRQALLHRDYSIYDRVANKLKGRTRDHEMIMKAAKKRRKPVLQYDLQGNFIKEYPGIKFVDGFEGKNISACCHGKLISTQGYIWRYKECEEIPKNIDIPIKRANMKKAVCQYSKSGEYITEYSSITEAAKAVGTTANKICQCLKGTQKTSKGFMWKYKKEVEVKDAVQ